MTDLNSLAYLVHQKEEELLRLQVELRTLTQEGQFDSDEVLKVRETALADCVSRL